MNLSKSLFLGLGLLMAAAVAPLALADKPPQPPPGSITWSIQTNQESSGFFKKWLDVKADAAAYQGFGTDGVFYTDWRLPTKAEYQAGISDPRSGPWPTSNVQWWTSQTKGSQNVWTAWFVVDSMGVPDPKTLTFQTTSSQSWNDAKFVRP